MSNFVAIHFD